MKKMKFYTGCAAVALAFFAVSCNTTDSSTPKAEIKTEVDTLSYAYGIDLSQGFTDYVQRLGVTVDTASFRMTETAKIEAELDQAKKEALKNALAGRIDSLKQANEKNLALFIKGLKESFESNTNDQNPYYNGLQTGAQIKSMSEQLEKELLDGKKLNKKAVLAGLIGSINKDSVLIADASSILQTKMLAAQQKAMAKQEEEAKKANASAIEEGEKFLAENKTKEGVVTLPSGLQYKIIKEGKGAIPTAQSKVKVHYAGTLINGTTFDSSIDRGEPVEFGVTQVIPGWTEVLQLMPVGSKWIVYIPYNLGYGAQQAGSIPPFSTLIFEISLLDIVQ